MRCEKHNIYWFQHDRWVQPFWIPAILNRWGYWRSSMGKWHQSPLHGAMTSDASDGENFLANQSPKCFFDVRVERWKSFSLKTAYCGTVFIFSVLNRCTDGYLPGREAHLQSAPLYLNKSIRQFCVNTACCNAMKHSGAAAWYLSLPKMSSLSVLKSITGRLLPFTSSWWLAFYRCWATADVGWAHLW